MVDEITFDYFIFITTFNNIKCNLIRRYSVEAENGLQSKLSKYH